MKALKDCTEGSTVMIGGQEWQVLSRLENGGTFCIRKELLAYRREFDKDNCNDWKRSSIRAYLNEEYKEELLQAIAAPEGEEIILDTTQDLTADDGLKDYGSSTDKVTMLTCEQYRKFRHLFAKTNASWWLITAVSTVYNRSSIVYENGTLYEYEANYGLVFVRPACTFNSDVFVEES